MTVFVALLPFILMHLLRVVMAPRWALLVSAALAAATVLRQLFDTGPKSLSLVALLLIGAAAALSFLRGDFAERGAGLVTNGGLALFVFGGLLLRRPFTLEWARDSVPAMYWTTPLFLQVNMMISLAWGLAFLVLTGLALGRPGAMPRWLRSSVVIAVMLAAGLFTNWYPGHARQAAMDAQKAAIGAARQ